MSTQQVNIKSTEFQPKNEYLLIKPVEFPTEKTTESGLIVQLAPRALDRPTIGQAVAVGADITDIKEGDTVLWPNTDGLDIEFEDGKFILLRYKSVIGMKK